MMRHSFIAALLAIVLTLSGQSMAVARGASPATGQMALCIGEGSVVVYTDDQGVPTSAPHFCPECTLSLMTALVPEGVQLARRGIEPAFIERSSAVSVPHRVILSYLSRAPPVLV